MENVHDFIPECNVVYPVSHKSEIGKLIYHSEHDRVKILGEASPNTIVLLFEKVL